VPWAVDTAFRKYRFYQSRGPLYTMDEATRARAEAVLPEKPAEAGSALAGGMETWG
jgi:hypothetical protein